ncbi:hypothetical protein [Clostridium sp.]|uniref:hypothetical protein n=1 Tax=Clostridium sp. TaxID=1506 RepID=UPI003216AFE1
MCMKLAELALETKDINVDVMSFGITVSHYSFSKDAVETIYFDSINFIEEDAEQRIEKALDYVRNLGGNKNGR